LLSLVFFGVLQVALNTDWNPAWQPPNAICANSQFITGSIFPTASGATVMVVRISKVVDSAGHIVGWGYDTLGLRKSGNFDRARRARYFVVNRAMTQRDMVRAGIHLEAGDRTSGLFQLPSKVWSDLRINACKATEMKSAKCNPWRPQDLPK